jgi:flagellar hook-associated protein 2
VACRICTGICSSDTTRCSTLASAQLRGIPYTSASNTVTGAIAGVTLNLASAAPGTTVQLTVAPDTSQATDAINNFVTAYNAVVNNLNTQFTVDPTSNTEGPLGSDTALRSLMNSLLNDATYAVTGSSGQVNLGLLGIDMNNDGTLTVNTVTTDTETSLADVLASNPSEVQNFFQNSAGTGFAQNFNNDLVGLTDATNGVINADIAGNQAQQNSLNDQITDMQTQITSQQQALTTELDQVNATLEEYPILLQEATAELNSLNGLLGSNSYSYTAPTAVSDTTPTAGSAASAAAEATQASAIASS